MHRKVQLIVSGGIRNGAGVAKALALGADAVPSARRRWSPSATTIPHLAAEYKGRGTTAGAYDDWHEGSDPAGITTQDPELMARSTRSSRGAAPRQLSEGDGARGSDDREGLRQEPRPQSGARRPLRTDDRGFRNGTGAARRNELETGQGGY